MFCRGPSRKFRVRAYRLVVRWECTVQYSLVPLSYPSHTYLSRCLVEHLETPRRVRTVSSGNSQRVDRSNRSVNDSSTFAFEKEPDRTKRERHGEDGEIMRREELGTFSEKSRVPKRFSYQQLGHVNGSCRSHIIIFCCQ